MFGCALVVNAPVTKFAVSRLPALMFEPAILPATVRTFVDGLKVKMLQLFVRNTGYLKETLFDL